MYCPACGTQNSDVSRFCLKCGTALPTRTPAGSQPKIKSNAPPMIGSNLRTGVEGLVRTIGMQRWIVIIVVMIVVAGVALIAAPRNPTEKVVMDMYDALTKGDMNAYMDTILPENRRMPNPWGVLGAMRVSTGPVGFDIGKLTQIALRDLRVSMLSAKGDYALVKVEGYLRMPTLSIEVRFCDEHDVRLRDGRWYVDVFAPERTKRVQLYQQKLLSDLQTAPSSGSGDLLTDMLGAMTGPQLERAANFCVD